MSVSGRPYHQTLAAALRALSLGLRFLFLLYLARRLSPAEVGVFGLYSAALIWASSLLVLDVYSTTTRQLLSDSADVFAILRRHLGFLAFVACLTFLTGFVLKILGVANAAPILASLFFVHLVAELVAQDLGRLLIPMGHVLASNLNLFLRSAFWIVPVVVLFELSPGSRDVLPIFALWLTGSIFGMILAFFTIFKGSPHKIQWPILDPKWILRAIQASAVIFMGTLLFRFLTNADRFIVEHYLGLETVGIYTVYIGIAFGLLSLMEVGVSAWHFSPMVKDIQAQRGHDALAKYQKFRRQNLISVVVLSLSIACIFPPIALWLLPSIYASEFALFWLLLGGVALYSFSLPDHYLIFGHKWDFATLTIYLTATVALAIASPFLIPKLDATGAGLSMFFMFSVIGVGRFLVAQKLKRRLHSCQNEAKAP